MDTNSVYCNSCGATNPAEARFCFKCGAQIQLVETSSVPAGRPSDFTILFCPNCGGKLEITPDIDRFSCKHCGNEQLVHRTGGVVFLAPVVEELKRVGTKFQAMKCPMCGANIKQYDRECGYCGSTLLIVSVEKTLTSKINLEILDSSALKWKAVLEHDPNSPQANYALGLAYLNQKLRDAALQHLQKASLLTPESPIIHYNLALTLFNDGNCEVNSEDYKNVVKEIDYALLLDPNFREAKAFKHFFIARKLDKINETEAIKEYETAIQDCPDIAILHNNLGLANYNLRNYSIARICFLKAIEIDPEYLMALSNLCLLSYVTGKYEDGIPYGRKAIELIRPTTLDRFQAHAYNNLSLCLWKTGHWDEAFQMIDRAIAIQPNDPLFQTNRENIQIAKPLPPEIEKSRRRRNNIIFIMVFILCVGCLVGFFAWVIYSSTTNPQSMYNMYQLLC